jgi:hypothetical protein
MSDGAGYYVGVTVLLLAVFVNNLEATQHYLVSLGAAARKEWQLENLKRKLPITTWCDDPKQVSRRVKALKWVAKLTGVRVWPIPFSIYRLVTFVLLAIGYILLAYTMPSTPWGVSWPAMCVPVFVVIPGIRSSRMLHLLCVAACIYLYAADPVWDRVSSSACPGVFTILCQATPMITEGNGQCCCEREYMGLVTNANGTVWCTPCPKLETGLPPRDCCGTALTTGRTGNRQLRAGTAYCVCSGPDHGIEVSGGLCQCKYPWDGRLCTHDTSVNISVGPFPISNTICATGSPASVCGDGHTL